MLVIIALLIGANLIAQIALLKQAQNHHRELLEAINRLVAAALDGRARQSSVTQSAGGPKQERAKQMGPRHPGTQGARQRKPNFVMKGGDYPDASDDYDSGLQQGPGAPPAQERGTA